MKKAVINKKLLLASLITTFFAILVHAYLTQHYYGLKFGTFEGQSLCNIDAVFNCDAVSASRFSSFLGIPLSIWGLFTNLTLLYFTTVGYLNWTQNQSSTLRYAALISGVTVLASLVMGAISFALLDNLCIFCLVAYALSIVGFICLLRCADQFKPATLLNDLKNIFSTEKWVGGFLLAIPILSFLANIMYLESHGLSEIEKIANEKVAYWRSSPEQKFDASMGLVAQNGSKEAIATIVEFADFRCPHCKQAATTLHAFLKNHPDVKLIFKPFPLDGTCNEAIKSGGDGISCGLAASVMCAEKLSQKGWAAHDYLFENQADVIQQRDLEKNLQNLSQSLGINIEDLKSCIKDPATIELVQKMAKEGEVAQIQGTPAIFLNGKLLSGGQLIPVLDAAYRSLINN